MTLEQIDIAIAEHLEWSEIRVGEGARIWGNRPNSAGQDYRKAAVPQFHACLNAMHWAELFLQNDDPQAYAAYCSNLCDECWSCQGSEVAEAEAKAAEAIFQASAKVLKAWQADQKCQCDAGEFRHRVIPPICPEYIIGHDGYCAVCWHNKECHQP